jgi:hypothetical protein
VRVNPSPPQPRPAAQTTARESGSWGTGLRYSGSWGTGLRYSSEGGSGSWGTGLRYSEGENLGPGGLVSGTVREGSGS